MAAHRFHYAWIICLCCTLVTICTTGLTNNVFSAYMPHLQAAGFSATQTSLAVSVRFAANFVGLLFVARVYGRISVRLGLALSCVTVAAGVLLFSFAASVPVLYGAAALTGFGSAIGSMIPIAVVLKRWFAASRGLAVGISASGTGVASMLFPGLITRLIASVGLAATFRLQCLFTLFMAAVMLLLVRNAPEDKGLEPFGAERPETAAAKEAGQLRRGLSRPEWLVLLAAVMLYGGAACSGPSHVSVVLMSGGVSEVTASLCVSLLGVSIMASKWIYGWAVDRVGGYRTNFFFVPALMIGFLLLCLAGGSRALAVTAVLIMGFGYPTATVGLSIWASDLASDADYTRSYERIQAAYVAGGALLANLPGVLFDAWGAYSYAFYILMGFILTMLLVIQAIYRRHGAHL